MYFYEETYFNYFTGGSVYLRNKIENVLMSDFHIRGLPVYNGSQKKN